MKERRREGGGRESTSIGEHAVDLLILLIFCAIAS